MSEKSSAWAREPAKLVGWIVALALTAAAATRSARFTNFLLESRRSRLLP